MSYVRRSLGEDEEIVYEAGFPWPYHLVSVLYLLLLGIIVVGIIVFLQRQIRAWTTEMVVTSQRIVLKEGWLSISTEELRLDAVEEVNVTQSFWGRLFNFGQLTLGGTGEGSIAFPPANRPVDFRSAIESARMQYEAG